MAVQILDNLIDINLMHATRNWLFNQPCLFGWKAHKEAKGSFWHKNFVLPGTNKHHYDNGVWDSKLSYTEFLKGQSPLAHVSEIIKDTLLNGKEPTRIWANFQSFGDESAIHRDFPTDFNSSSKTVVWYPVVRWDKDWGGDLITLSDDGEISSCTIIKPNRVIAIDKNQLHSPRPISRYAEELRIAISFASELIYD